jgi:hypothetical protein
VSFTRQRMFVLSEDGKVFVFRINEKAPVKDIYSRKKPAFTGELVLENPIFVKDLPPIK